MFIIPYALTVDVSLGQFEKNDISSALIYDWGTAGWGHILYCTWGQDWQGYQIVIV